MKKLPPGSVVFYFSRKERISLLIKGLLFTLAGICFLCAVQSHSANSFFVFYTALAIGAFCGGIYSLKQFWQKVHCILTPQYVQIGGRRFAINELECAHFDIGPWDGAFIITRAAYKRLPFFHKVIHRYTFLLMAALLVAAVGIYGILFHQIPIRICIKALVAAAGLAYLGLIQYQNGRIYGFQAGELGKEVLEEELSSFCTTHQITFYYN